MSQQSLLRDPNIANADISQEPKRNTALRQFKSELPAIRRILRVATNAEDA